MISRLLAVAVVVAAGASLTQCEQHYRYACQDPANWDKDYCKKPLCEVNKDCPEHIFGEKEKAEIAAPVAPAPASTTGDCK